MTTPAAVPKRWHGRTSDADVKAIFAALAKVIVPKTELAYSSPFELLVAVVLSAQSTDKGVNAATATLFPVANTPAAMARLGAAGILPYIRKVNFAPTKAKNVARLSELLLARHGGEVPGTREELEALPGVGHKTASVVLNVVFGQATIAVDTHVHRVSNRLGIVRTTAPEQTEQVLLLRTPPPFLRNAHHYLILHGRYTCVARAPKCPVCPVARWCPRIGVKTPAPG
jgi:endonuclease-3